MSDYLSSYTVVQGIKLHYYRTGVDKPPLVLAHGITDDGLCWTPVAEVFAGDYDVIMVDARGHGKSEAPGNGYTLRNLAGELAGLIQALRLDKPILLGHSMGAITSLLLAGLFPALPRAVILEDPPPFWNPSNAETQNDEFINSFAQWIKTSRHKTRDELLAEARTQNPGWSEAELAPWVKSKQRYSLNILALIHPKDIATIDFPKLMNQITCPALFICADPQLGAASRPQDVARLKEMLPHLQVVSIARAGHNIRRDQFAAYIKVVRQFLAGLQ